MRKAKSIEDVIDDAAWKSAVRLYDGASKDQMIDELELLTQKYLLDIIKPSCFFKIFTAINRFFENRSIKKHRPFTTLSKNTLDELLNR